MNMINGIIISAFSQIREENNNRKEDQENKCFICDRNRFLFEKKKVSFTKHMLVEHNYKNYMYYFITLLRLSETDLNSDETYILNCINNKDISFFPVKSTLAIEDEAGDSDEDHDEDHED